MKRKGIIAVGVTMLWFVIVNAGGGHGGYMIGQW